MTLYTHPVQDITARHAIPLTYDQRQRSRLFLHLNDVDAAHIILPRGMHLHAGLHIQAEDGSVLRIDSAGEDVSLVAATGHALACACYQLGNRQIPAAITADGVSYQRDAGIDDMMKGLGFAVVHRKLPFEPDVRHARC